MNNKAVKIIRPSFTDESSSKEPHPPNNYLLRISDRVADRFSDYTGEMSNDNGTLTDREREIVKKAVLKRCR